MRAMREDWPTHTEDVRAAKQILDRYKEKLDDLDAENLVHFMDFVDSEIQHSEALPEWVIEMLDFFIDRYGYEHGYAVMSMVMTHFLLGDETVH